MPSRIDEFVGDGRYLIVNVVARRARDINKSRQATNIIDEKAPDPMDVAMNEYENGLLQWEFHHNLVGLGDDFRST
ncbi:MAG: DNA-directed RNA polymerase subunit omega [Candidatus Sumerlaeia bacterium]|nr:DNA-directed RNA polymerase subunit omega [Candidatus Sumerlaeia bacterium]